MTIVYYSDDISSVTTRMLSVQAIILRKYLQFRVYRIDSVRNVGCYIPRQIFGSFYQHSKKVF